VFVLLLLKMRMHRKILFLVKVKKEAVSLNTLSRGKGPMFWEIE